jgi:hypothetical protein
MVAVAAGDIASELALIGLPATSTGEKYLHNFSTLYLLAMLREEREDLRYGGTDHGNMAGIWDF